MAETPLLELKGITKRSPGVPATDRVDLDLRLLDAVAASATTLGNVGPAFGFAGPMGSFDPFSGVSKGVMIVLMWLGRLEIIPVAVLLSRHYWRP